MRLVPVGFVSQRDLDLVYPRLVVALLALSLITPPALLAENPVDRQVHITAEVGNVRSAASASSQILFQVRRGDTLRLIDTSGDWYLIEAPGGKRGYVYRTLAEVVEPPPPALPTPTPPPPPSAPALGVAIDHKEVGCVLTEHYPKLDACLTPGTNVGRAQIHFRVAETDPWYAVELKPDGPCYSGFLPKPSRATKQFQYYVDVIDRGFTEVEKPESAPQGAYVVKVVKKEGDCDSNLKRLAYSVAKAAAPIVVSIAKDAAGSVLDAAAAQVLEGHMLLTGFSSQGVVAASTGAAPSAAAGSASTSGATGAAAGAAGGIAAHMGLILGVAGGVAAAGVVAAVAHSSGSSSPTLTGHWVGTGKGNSSDSGGLFAVSCSYSLSADLTQSGNTVTGTFSSTGGSCNSSGSGCVPGVCGTTPVMPGSGPVSGSVSGGQVSFTAAGAPSSAQFAQALAGSGCTGSTSPLQGTWSGNTLNLTDSANISCPFENITAMDSYTLTRQ
jgi:hypothetical protein